MNVHHIFETTDGTEVSLRSRHRPAKCEPNSALEFPRDESIRHGFRRKNERFEPCAQRAVRNPAKECGHCPNLRIAEVAGDELKIIVVYTYVTVVNDQNLVCGFF